ncbi:fibronectin type III domain-containing protein [Herbiconiux sp. 11R-BC]|uniref:fibronectin type III domain-containing protein n=1 Tax=Herbiconiux sp. 11R-BC TaxID=3111637 RepID=UPI003BFFA654
MHAADATADRTAAPAPTGHPTRTRRWRLRMRTVGAIAALAIALTVASSPAAAFAAAPEAAPMASTAAVFGAGDTPGSPAADDSTMGSGPESPTAAGSGSGIGIGSETTPSPAPSEGEETPASAPSESPTATPEPSPAPSDSASLPAPKPAAIETPAPTSTSTSAPTPASTPSLTSTSPATPTPAPVAAAPAVVPTAPTPLPASTWVAPATPAPGQVLVQADPAGVDFGVDISWAPPTAVTPLGYRVELFTGRSVTNSNALVARVELDAAATRYRVEGVGFGSTSVIARVTLLDGASALPGPLVSDVVPLPAASAGALSTARAGTPVLSAPTAEGFAVRWEAAAGDPAPAGYLVRILERRHDQVATSANSFIATTLDVGSVTSAVVTGLQGSSRYLAGVVAYDLVGGVKQFRGSSPTSAVPAWSSDFAAQTLGTRAPASEWSSIPPAPTAESARTVSWTGPATTGRYTGGAAVTGYRVELFAAGSGLVARSDVAVTDPAAAPVARFGGLTPGTAYSVRVAAVNSAGVGEFSDFSPLVTTPQGSTPGSRAPAFADRAALQAAIDTGAVADASAGPGGSTTVEQGQDATVTVPWTVAQTGEAWWYGDAVFAGTATSGTAASARPQLTVSTKGLAVGEHWLLFVSDSELNGGPAIAGGGATVVLVRVVPSTAGTLTLDDAVLRWGLNDETNNGAYFGGCNYLSAGRTPDPGGSAVFAPSQYSADAQNVVIEKPDASGRYVRASWDTKCLDRTGAPLGSGTTTPFGGNQFVMSGGTGQVDVATGSASIRWDADVTVVYYGGLSFWYLSDPVLTVENGAGTLTATVGGFGSDRDDASTWVPLAERSVTLAVFSGVQVGADGFTVTPDYRGVAVSVPAGQSAQARSGADWGAFPQSFIDFHGASGQAAYWYSSGGQADSAKVALPFAIGYDAASFAAPVAPAETAEKASARVPVGKLPPPKLPAAAVLPAAPALADAAPVAVSAASSVVIVESPASEVPAREVLLLLFALVALLGLVTVIAGVGGGLVALGKTARVN